MNDLISRQAAIDAADRADYAGLSVEDVKKVTDEVVKELKRSPSSQPVDKDINVLINDTISRQAAIDALSIGKEMLSRVLDDMDVVGADREKYSWGLGLIESYINDIRELPSAQQELKTAHWIPLDERFSRSDYFKCSECGFRIKWENVTDFGGQSVDYCPHCGAKMEVENG